jgi:hypothetical protein
MIIKSLLMLTALYSLSSNALEYYTNENVPNTLLLEGKFEQDDDKTFKTYVNEHKIKAVIFDSVGGNLIASMNIGTHMRANGLTSELLKGSVCYSACSYAFMGGVSRSIHGSAEFAMHRPYFENETVGKYNDGHNSGIVASVMISTYLIEMGMEPSVAISHLLSEELSYFSPTQQQIFKIITS